MNQDNIRQLIEAAAVEFEPSVFLDAILTTLQIAKSNAAFQTNVLFDTAIDVTSSSKGESNINTFLRLLGMPATRYEGKLNLINVDKGELPSLLSQGETLNYVKLSELSDLIGADGKDAAKKTVEREGALSKQRSIEDHFEMISNPLPLMVSIEGRGQRRPSLFPLIVSADVPVFPLKKRTAPAFFKGDFIRGDSRLSRPFLEHIIYMRTKNFSGAANPLKDALRANILAEINNLPNDSSNETGDAQNSGNPQGSLISNLQNFNLLELQLIDKFIKSLKSSAERYFSIEKENEALKKKLLYIPNNKDTQNEKAGQAKLSDTQIKTLLEEIGQEQSPNISSRTIYAKKQKIKEQRAIIESFTQLLPIESLNLSDQIRRLGDPFTTNNIINDVFVSEFSQLTSFELTAIDGKMRELEEEEAGLVQQYETVRSGIMFYTGEIIGLSIFDIICVLFALFTVELKYLVALLNESSKERLVNSDKFYSSETPNNGNVLFTSISEIVEDASQISVGQAVNKVQDQVKNHFNLAQSFYVQSDKGGENRTRETA